MKLNIKVRILAFLVLLTLSISCKSSKSMSEEKTYFLLKLNNRLQTDVFSVNPFIFISNKKKEVNKRKKELELKFLRNAKILDHFDWREYFLDKELIEFDEFLIEEFSFSFLYTDFDHSSEEVNGKIFYDKKFPSHLSDSGLFKIQKKMDKYHFHLVEKKANGNFIILFEKMRVPGDWEDYVLENEFQSFKDAKSYIETKITDAFDDIGSTYIVGPILKNELTKESYEILKLHNNFKYGSGEGYYGTQFTADKKLKDIENGFEILIQLLNSVNRKVDYKIIELK